MEARPEVGNLPISKETGPETPELTGEEVRLGNLDPLKKIKRIPVFVGILAMFGPGVVWAAMAQGSGELIWWPYLVAKYGTAFIGIILPACLLQLWVNVEIGRYTATTGETIFTGFTRVHKAYAALMWVMMLAAFFWFGGYASGGASALAALTGFPAGWSARGSTLFWSYLTIIVFSSAIIFGKVVYRVIEKFMTGIVIITVVGLVLAAFNPEVTKHVGTFFANYFAPWTASFPVKFDPKDYDPLATAIAFAGMGGFFNLMYSYWLRDKGVCTAKYIGRITSPLTGEPESIPATGYVFADTEENRKNYRGWIKYLWADSGFAIGVNAFTLMLTSLLAYALLLPKGLVPKGWEIAVVQATFFQTSWGAIGRAIFLLVAAAFLSDTWLGITDAVARMHADFFYSNFPGLRKYQFRSVYYFWVAFLILVSASTMLIAAPGTLLLLGGVVNFLSMAIYIPALIYLNYFMIPKVFPKWTRPSNVNLAFTSVIGAIFAGLSLWYLKIKFF